MAKRWDLNDCKTRNDLMGYVNHHPGTKEIRTSGSHIIVKGPLPGSAVMCGHGNEPLPRGTLKSIIKMLVAIGLGILAMACSCGLLQRAVSQLATP